MSHNPPSPRYHPFPNNSNSRLYSIYISRPVHAGPTRSHIRLYSIYISRTVHAGPTRSHIRLCSIYISRTVHAGQTRSHIQHKRGCTSSLHTSHSASAAWRSKSNTLHTSHFHSLTCNARARANIIWILFFGILDFTHIATAC